MKEPINNLLFVSVEYQEKSHFSYKYWKEV